MRFRILKWVSLGLGALVALLLLTVLVLVWVVDPNSYKSHIEAAVRDATGREFSLVGDIELGFFPWVSLKTGEGRFGNAPGFGPEPMVSWKHAQLGAKLFPLLGGKVVADDVILEGADVRLVRRADGTANWQGIGSQAPAKPASEEKPLELRIASVRIKDSRVSFVDEAVPRRVEVTALNLATEGIEPGEPFTDTDISGVLHMDGFVPEGVPFRFEVPKAVLPADFSAVDVEKFSLAFGGFEAKGGVKGTLGEKPVIAGQIETNVFDPRAVLKATGIEPPKTTDEKALGKLQVTAGWKFDAGAVALEPFTLLMDETRFSGQFRMGAGESAVGEFALRGDALDIGRYLPPADPASEPFVLPTAMLRSLQFRGTLELEQANYDDIVMKGVTLRLLLDDHGLRQAAPAP